MEKSVFLSDRSHSNVGVADDEVPPLRGILRFRPANGLSAKPNLTASIQYGDLGCLPRYSQGDWDAGVSPGL